LRQKEERRTIMSIYAVDKQGRESNAARGIFDPKLTRIDGGSILYFTLHDVFSADSLRVRGEYHFKSITNCILDDDTSTDESGRAWYTLKMEFFNIEEARELYRLIRSGKIWPVFCYEDVQVPAPCRHIKDLFREAFEIIRREISQKYRNLF